MRAWLQNLRLVHNSILFCCIFDMYVDIGSALNLPVCRGLRVSTCFVGTYFLSVITHKTACDRQCTMFCGLIQKEFPRPGFEPVISRCFQMTPPLYQLSYHFNTIGIKFYIVCGSQKWL